MTKRILCSTALLAALAAWVCLPAAAQDASAMTPVPAMSYRVLEAPSPGKWIAPALVPHTSTPPSYCDPCLFYEGDLNPSAQNANGFANERTVLVDYATTYAAFQVPAGEHWQVTGLITNNQTDDFGILDPNQALWSISTGLSAGNPGTVIASGVATPNVTPTGRSFHGFSEYTLAVAIPKVDLDAGQYWLSVEPQCTNGSDWACVHPFFYAEFFLSNTDLTNAYGPTAPKYKGFFSSDYFNYYYAPLCTVSPDGCEYSSVGVIGTAK
ncbi:MAG TPA: hypothetical protein VI455_15235 [Terriglobia bacterium]